MGTDSTQPENVMSIKPINVDTVHKICSGQVVLNLAIAVKELVENSLDAGATNIEIRLKNYGIDLIEVSDNGHGVTDDNFAALTLKYHTSKLNDYADLLGVTSFGFRGEALSSLCALASLTITTRHNSSEHATKIEYDNKGNIVKKTPCSRQVGTTVTLSNLFSSLPVRQKEFHRNSKREFNKMTQLLYAYCLISVGVKITCTNQTSNNSKTLVVATQGALSYKDNIASVFGHKQLQTLLELNPVCTANIKYNILKGLSDENDETENSADVNIDDVEIDLSEDSNDIDSVTDNCSQVTMSSQKSDKSQGYKNIVNPVKFSGFISSCAHGSGRSSTDRQFYFINSRPCEPPKIIKLINEIYRQHNPNQYPFVFLNINIERSCVDVNVTPDKRKVFLTKEKIILDVVKSSILRLFESIPRTLKVEPSESFINSQILEDNEPDEDQPKVFKCLLQFASKTRNTQLPDLKNKIGGTELKRKSPTILDYVSKKVIKIENDKYSDLLDTSAADSEKVEIAEAEKSCEGINNTYGKSDTSDNKSNETSDMISDDDSNLPEITKLDIVFLESTDILPNTQIRYIEDIMEQSHTIRCKVKDSKLPMSMVKQEIRSIKPKTVLTDKEDLGKHTRKTINLKTSIDHVKALAELCNNQKSEKVLEKIKFRSRINPVFNKKCEEELSKEISKDSFNNMKVIGQFNLGFIITQLEDDLFIIDQHATDEIYNFETLQKTSELTNQKLVIPQQLELTGVNEQILMDNLEVFKKNGFTFDIDENAMPTKRVKLLTIPMSKNWVFGKEDIEELLFMLRESPSEYCRPSRVRAMFASRACRKSVMIGTALSKSDMKKLVDHMAEIDKPWNCPHGRPTIRHLVNLAVTDTENK